jgi:hypothetical protein
MPVLYMLASRATKSCRTPYQIQQLSEPYAGLDITGWAGDGTAEFEGSQTLSFGANGSDRVAL